MMTFNEVLTEAVRDFVEYGYDGGQRLSEWMQRLRNVADAALPPPKDLEKTMKAAMDAFFKKSLTFSAMTRRHPGISRYTIERITPSLRPELTRRIMASADLIKLNRDQALEKTMQRFSGWATSIPEGGSRVVDKVEVKTAIAKSIRQIKYEERRVAIDQGHKLMASIDAVVAVETAAVAGMWRSHWRDSSYNYRPDHKERDKKVYAIRGNWAIEKGLMNKGAGYTDEMTQPGEEVFCRCYMVYLQNLRDLPDDMLTVKGRKVLDETRLKAA